MTAWTVSVWCQESYLSWKKIQFVFPSQSGRAIRNWFPVYSCTATTVAVALWQTVTAATLSVQLHSTRLATLHMRLRLAALRRNRRAESATLRLWVSTRFIIYHITGRCVHPFIFLSCQLLLPQYLVNVLSSLDETY